MGNAMLDVIEGDWFCLCVVVVVRRDRCGGQC